MNTDARNKITFGRCIFRSVVLINDDDFQVLFCGVFGVGLGLIKQYTICSQFFIVILQLSLIGPLPFEPIVFAKFCTTVAIAILLFLGFFIYFLKKKHQIETDWGVG